MSNRDFGASINNIISDCFTPEGLKMLEWYAAIMSLHPYSREQILQQVASLRHSAVSKECLT